VGAPQRRGSVSCGIRQGKAVRLYASRDGVFKKASRSGGDQGRRSHVVGKLGNRMTMQGVALHYRLDVSGLGSVWQGWTARRRPLESGGLDRMALVWKTVV